MECNPEERVGETWEEGSDEDADAGPEVGEGPGDVDGQLGHLARGGVRVDDVQSKEPTHRCIAARMQHKYWSFI